MLRLRAMRHLIPHTDAFITANRIRLPSLNNISYSTQVIPNGISMATVQPVGQYEFSPLAFDQENGIRDLKEPVSTPAAQIASMVALDLPPAKDQALKDLPCSPKDILLNWILCGDEYEALSKLHFSMVHWKWDGVGIQTGYELL